MNIATPNPRASFGGNSPPPFDPDVVEALNDEGAKFLDAAAVWIENGDLDSEDDAQRLNDFITGIKKRKSATETARKGAKKPHDDAGKLVQAAFLPIAKKMDLALSKVAPLLTKWMNKKRDEEQAEIERKRKEAEFAQQEADRKAAAAAARNDISGEIDAQAEREEADKQAKDAERAAKKGTQVSSATGGGRTASLRTYVEVSMVNPRVAFMRYNGHPALDDCLTKLAQVEARSKDFNPETDTIPGFDIRVERRAV